MGGFSVSTLSVLLSFGALWVLSLRSGIVTWRLCSNSILEILVSLPYKGGSKMREYVNCFSLISWFWIKTKFILFFGLVNQHGQNQLWWVCACWSKCVSGTDNSPISSGTFFRVASFPFDTCNALLFPDAFSKEALIPTFFPRSEFAVTLVISRPEGAFIDLIANSILGATMLSMAVKMRSEFRLLPHQQYCSSPCQSFHWNIFPRFLHSPYSR